MTNKEHKDTFKQPKTRFYKKAAFPWIIILTVSVFFGGVVTGWVLRSDFANEVSHQVKTVLDEKAVKDQQ